MAYTNVWNNSTPLGSAAANTIDNIFRSVKVDITERFTDIFAMPNFTDDPLRPYGIKFTDAQDSVISLGDNGGTPRAIAVKNKAGSTTYATLAYTGITLSPPTLTGSSIPFLSVSQTWNNVATTFVGMLVNITDTNSASASLFFDYQVGGTTKWKVSKTGAGQLASSLTIVSGGLSVNAGGITVVSGTSALQALTATTGVFSSTISATSFTGAVIGNASTATTLATTRSIWGQNFNGSADVTGAISSATTITASGLITGSSGLTISSGTSALQAVTATTVTATTFTGALTGNASTATALQTARTINGVPFDGTGNITVDAGTVGTLTFGTYLQAASASFGGSDATIATNATSSNVVSTLVARDASGDFSARIITLSGGLTVSSGTSALQALTATTGTFSGSLSGTSASFSSSISATSGTFSSTVTSTVAGIPLIVDNTSAATILGAIQAKRGTTTRYFIGFNASDEFALLNAAGDTVNLSVTNAGSATIRAGLTVTTGGIAVSAGTTALQAITGTTLNLTGAVTLSANVTQTLAAADATYELRSNGGSGRRWQFTSKTDGRLLILDATAGSARLEIDSAGLFQINAGGLAVLAGTSALQAITGTTLVLSSTATSTAFIQAGTPATAGVVRIANSNVIAWRNAGNTDDYYFYLNNSNVFRAETSGGTAAPISVGAITGNNGLTISSGTSALQAITGTTGVFSSSLSAASFFAVASGQKIFVDGVAGSGDTYLIESSADVAKLFVGGVESFSVTETAGAITTVFAGTLQSSLLQFDGSRYVASVTNTVTTKIEVSIAGVGTRYLLAATTNT